jgi:hypothetical protein
MDSRWSFPETGRTFIRDGKPLYLLAFDLRHDYSAEAWRRASGAVCTMFDGCVPLYSAWLIDSRLSATEIVDALLEAGAIHEDDGIVALHLSGKGRFRNMAPPESAKWLGARLARP